MTTVERPQPVPVPRDILPSRPIDSSRWPDVARVPHDPVRVAIARRIWRRAVSRLPLQVIESDGGIYGGGGPDAPVMFLVRPAAFLARLGATGTIGFGEAYMAGDWTTEDLTGVLSSFAGNMRRLVPQAFQRLRHAVLTRVPQSHDNTVENARSNVSHHYDLSNDLFSTFLDETMTYSSALFRGEPYGSPRSLADAQRAKIDRLLDIAAVGEGTDVLEIGTGWGELALRAARRGAHVTSLTLSTEQADLARERVSAAGLADRVDVQLRDYRAAEGTYEAVVSVEMIEAVGANHWDTYFSTIDRVLRPGGRMGLQAILMDDAAVRATMDTYTWIRKYIFPGGQIASLPAIERSLGRTGLRISDAYHFGRHYAETLRRWRDRFESATERIEALGFDETFRRMWSFYLAYSEAGFRTGYLDVAQITLTKTG
jgi:cyclopropane-fatty-acyl-phospholipid synthase